MVDALETTPQHRRDPAGVTPVAGARAAEGPSLSELITEAHKLARRDDLPFSGHIVIERRGTAEHKHNVWLLGPFALIEGGWFGQVHGSEHRAGKPQKWLRNHEKKCAAVHWTQFRTIDETSLAPGCGAVGIGIGIGPDGPTYCAFTAGEAGQTEADHEHVPMVKVLRAGLRELADRADRR